MEDTPDIGERLEFSASVAPGPEAGTIVTIFGELDVASAPEMTDSFQQAIDRPGPVELDMRGCTFVDSTGIASLLTAARRLHEQGRVLTIKGARERVQSILQLSGLLSQGWIALD